MFFSDATSEQLQTYRTGLIVRGVVLVSFFIIASLLFVRIVDPPPSFDELRCDQRVEEQFTELKDGCEALNGYDEENHCIHRVMNRWMEPLDDCLQAE